MTPGEFIAKWRSSELKERSAAQEHFIDLCRLLDEPTPAEADLTGEHYCFERGARKDTGGDGWADVWRQGCFAWAYKGKHADLDATFSELRQYAQALENPPLLIVADTAWFRIRTNWTNSVSETHEFALDDLADAANRDKLKWALSDPGRLRPPETRQTVTERVAARTTADKSKQATSISCTDIEIFAGAGGLTLGLQNAGFHFSHVFEIDPHSCETLKYNHSSKGGLLHCEVCEEDVSTLNWDGLKGPIRLFAGGAPCQPFSLAGRHLADKDDRNMFPEVLRAVRSLRPQAVMIENVQGLARPSFRPYLEYILRQLEWVSVAPRKEEEWQEHDDRISQHQETTTDDCEYHVNWAQLEAADYGIAQNRRRVFIIATRVDIAGMFIFPQATNKKEALIRTQNNGEYWKNRRLTLRKDRLNGTAALNFEAFAAFDPWKTVRDAISDLPSPAASELKSDNNHWSIPGARIYRGHSGSRLDWPSKTIKAGVHGVPGGENIVLLDDGTYRYFTLRETARLQGFPDDFVFHGARLHITRQIGNAVPVDLAEAIGRRLFQQLSGPTNKISPADQITGNRRGTSHE